MRAADDATTFVETTPPDWALQGRRLQAERQDAEDRRDARLSALTLAVHVLPETPAAALADGTPIEAVTLRIARAFERYLLGDDPPKPPAKME